MTDVELAALADSVNATGHAVGWVWHCDGPCDCSQAVIAQVRPTSSTEPDPLWSGALHTDGRRGAFDELHTVAVALQAAHPAAHDLVDWR